jgi:hypothetical protein
MESARHYLRICKAELIFISQRRRMQVFTMRHGSFVYKSLSKVKYIEPNQPKSKLSLTLVVPGPEYTLTIIGSFSFCFIPGGNNSSICAIVSSPKEITLNKGIGSLYSLSFSCNEQRGNLVANLKVNKLDIGIF